MAANILKRRMLWVITAVVFLVLIIFFDRNSYMDRARLKGDIKELEVQRNYYLDRIRDDSTVMEKLRDDAYLEQYAREHFLMKREGDVVYVMEP